MANITFDDIALDIPCGSGGSETLDEVLANGNEAIDKSIALMNADGNARTDMETYSFNQSYDDGHGYGTYTNISNGMVDMGEYSDATNFSANLNGNSINMEGSNLETGESSYFGMYLFPGDTSVGMSDDVKEAFKTALGTPSYELCVEDSGGNVVEVGNILINNKTYGIFEFYYKTSALPNTTVKTFPLANLLADYSIMNFIDATGITSDGIFIGNGRTDNNNRLIVQQFSRNNKNFQIRTYQDFSTQTATVKIKFIGTKA